MRLSSRSYPHPVVGNRDDVPGAAFQVVLGMTTDKEAVYIDADINCSSRTINDLVRAKDAVFALHIECSNTVFRRVVEFADPKHRVQISADNLNDAVEVNAFAVAARDLFSYRVDGAHADYGNAQFRVEKGGILALGEGRVFDLDPEFDSLRPIGSIMAIHEAQEDGDLPMRVNFSEPKIQVMLSKADFSEYRRLKPIEGVSMALTTTIVLPVLIEGLRIAKDNEVEYEGLRWVRVLRQRVEDMGLKLDQDALLLAQRILELPIRRALAAAMRYAEGGEN